MTGRVVARSTVFLAVLGAGACVDNPVDPADRYPGPVEPCEVSTDAGDDDSDLGGRGDTRPDPFETEPPAFWLPGPYWTWNTTPSASCSEDPTIPYVATEIIMHEDGTTEEFEHRDVKMYMTYPTETEPTITGDGSVADGKFPVIVFAHANNDRTCNIFRGYWSLHDHWASWGFVVVAIDGTDLNCKRGSKQNLDLRSDGQIAAIEALRELNENEDSRFFGHLDMDKVILAGHSRGGGASLYSQTRYPESLGVIDLQGVAATAWGYGRDPLPPFPVISFTAGEDVDLNYPYVEPTEDVLGGEYTWVNVTGGTHAHTADGAPVEPDDHPLISREQQHNVTEYYSTAFLARHAGVPTEIGGERKFFDSVDDILFSHVGSTVAREQLTPLGVFVRWRTIAPALWVDDFDSPLDGNDPARNLLDGSNESSNLTRSEEVPTYSPDEAPSYAYSYSYSRLLEASGTGEFTMQLAPEGGAIDLSAFSTLQFRVKGPDKGDIGRLRVAFSNGDELSIDDYRSPVPLEDRFDQVVIPLSDFATDVTAVTFVRLEVSSGALFVDDLRFVE